MDRKNEHTKAKVGILASGIVLLVVIFCHMLGSDLAKQPGLLRNIRLVLDILQEDHIRNWEAWYAEHFLAKLLVWLITLTPVVTMIVSVCAWFGWALPFPTRRLRTIGVDTDTAEADLPRSRKTRWSNPFDMDTDEEEELPREEPTVKEKVQNPDDYRLENNWRQAMERLETLHARCRLRLPVMDEPCVRVQMLSGDPKQRIDQILEWFGTPNSYYASVRINPQYEILLTLDENGNPAIVSLCDQSENDEPDWVEELYPLDPGVPTVLVRPSGQGTVNRYAITWLGGNNI